MPGTCIVTLPAHRRVQQVRFDGASAPPKRCDASGSNLPLACQEIMAHREAEKLPVDNSAAATCDFRLSDQDNDTEAAHHVSAGPQQDRAQQPLEGQALRD